MGSIFNDQQNADLAKPLSRAAVKGRQQGGRQVSYIEGWHVIAEANRIFGFDGWSRETVEIKCVHEGERKIGQQGATGWGVSYIAKVRVRIGDLIREGCGSGHGIDRDCGQAHESALKEAETDAMKRALMTFGNPFGLALYDKTQENVADEPRQDSDFVHTLKSKIDQCMTVKALDTYGMSIQPAVSKLSPDEAAAIRDHFASRKKALKGAENLAA